MLFAAKCYWPGLRAVEFERETAPRLSISRQVGAEAEYVGSLVFGDDALVLCLYESSSRSAVATATHRARIPCERIMEFAWLPAAPEPLSKSGGVI